MEGNVGTIAMSDITDGIIPAKTGVVIRGEAGNYVFNIAESDGTTNTEGNMLYGYAGSKEFAVVEKPVDGSTNYVLAVEGGKVGFYKKDQDPDSTSTFKVYNHKAYLNVPSSVKARALYFNFDDNVTGIVETENGNEKSENCYDLSGRRVEGQSKGVYIVNGKKVLK
jgi:hypothetical protein